MAEVVSNNPVTARYYDQWLAEIRRTRAVSTTKEYGRTVGKLLQAHPDKDAQDFDETVIEKFLERPRRSRGPRISALKSFFGYLSSRGLIPGNPMDRVPQVPHTKRPRDADPFTQADYTKLRALPLPDGALFTLMFECGLRKEACRMLVRRDLHPEIGYLTAQVRGQDETVPMSPRAGEAVAQLDSLGLAPGDHLWGTNPGGGKVIKRENSISQTAFQNWWKLSLARARVRHRPADATPGWFKARQAARHESGAVEDVATLMVLLPRIADPDTRGYVEEAITCLEHGARRAAVVFVWSGVVRTLQDAALAKGERDLNDALRKQFPAARKVSAIEDFDWIKDRTFLEACPDLGLLSRKDKNRLVGWLNLRNDCGHPTGYRPTAKMVGAFIEEVVPIVFP